MSDDVARATAGWLLLLAAGCFACFSGSALLVASGARCDDSCGGPADGWQHDIDSRVWELLGWAGVAMLVLVLVAVVVVCVRPWRRGTWVPLAVAAALFAVMSSLGAPDDGDALPLTLLLVGATGAAVCAGARLTEPPGHSRATRQPGRR